MLLHIIRWVFPLPSAAPRVLVATAARPTSSSPLAFRMRDGRTVA